MTPLSPEVQKQIQELVTPVGRNIDIECPHCGVEFVTAEPELGKPIKCCQCKLEWIP